MSFATDLYSVIDKHNVHGLNLTTPEHAKELIKPWSDRDDTTLSVDSGVDDQIIIHIPFMENVRLRSILLKIGTGDLTPRHLRIYANHPTIIDFADAESTKPQLDISLSEDESGVVEYPLRIAAFASVHSLSLFFNESIGGDVSRLYFIGFKGDSQSNKQPVNSTLDVAAQNTGDAKLVDRLNEKRGQQTTAR